MLTPHDKLTSGANDIIQIVVTTACNLFTCSNCTQLLPFRKDYLHMTPACFEQAVISLKDWPGIVSLFGGNPCSHPYFADLCGILSDHIPQERRGLWSNDLLRHGQTCRDTFYPHGRFNLNAHAQTAAAAYIDKWLPGQLIETSRSTAAWHSAILLHYRDFGILESEWIQAREHCDINQHWSAAIVERDGQPYAYFCEVAAALDGIRKENHGLPAIPGWWQEPMAHYATQVHQCCDQGCGVPLRAKGHPDSETTYDISPSFAPLTVYRQGKVALQHHGPQLPDQTPEVIDYMRSRT